MSEQQTRCQSVHPAFHVDTDRPALAVQCSYRAGHQDQHAHGTFIGDRNVAWVTWSYESEGTLSADEVSRQG